jgi:glycine/D-amino acid oxidase-like deaminating enzyme
MVESLQTLLHLARQHHREGLFTQSGSIRVAATPARAEELRATTMMAARAGLEARLLDPAEVGRLIPRMRTEDLLLACLFPSDGYLHPPEVAELYIRAGRAAGVEYRERCPVTRLTMRGGRVVGCETAEGPYHAEVVVNAAGAWSHLVAGLIDQRFPSAGVGHCYLTAFPDPPFDPWTPSIRDRGHRLYARPTREGAFHVGVYEPHPVVFEMEAIPPELRMRDLGTGAFGTTIEMLQKAARHRFPWLTADVPVRYTTGIMSWSPDGHPLCGAIPGVEGLYHCAAFCGHGVMQSAAAGLLMADLIVDGRWRFDPAELAAERWFDWEQLPDRAAVDQACGRAYAQCYGALEGDAFPASN